jgi:drug/metabolite transporter (DMT)-like permease
MALLICLGRLWGASFSISKIAMDEGIPPFGYAAWQSLGAAALLAALALARGERLAAAPPVLAFGLFAGLFGVGTPHVIFYYAIGHLPAGLMAVVVTIAPISTYAGALPLGLERRNWVRVAGLGIGLVGALALLFPDMVLPTSGSLPGLDLRYLALGFLVPLLYSANALYASVKRPQGVSSLVLAMYMMLGAASGQIPMVFLLGQAYAPLPPFTPGDLALLSHIAATSLAYVIYFDVLRRAGPVFFSQVSYVVALTGLFWGAVFFGERLGLGVYGPAVLILLGLALVNRRPPGGPAEPGPRQSPPRRTSD